MAIRKRVAMSKSLLSGFLFLMCLATGLFGSRSITPNLTSSSLDPRSASEISEVRTDRNLVATSKQLQRRLSKDLSASDIWTLGSESEKQNHHPSFRSDGS